MRIIHSLLNSQNILAPSWSPQRAPSLLRGRRRCQGCRSPGSPIATSRRRRAPRGGSAGRGRLAQRSGSPPRRWSQSCPAPPSRPERLLPRAPAQQRRRLLQWQRLRAKPQRRQRRRRSTLCRSAVWRQLLAGRPTRRLRAARRQSGKRTSRSKPQCSQLLRRGRPAADPSLWSKRTGARRPPCSSDSPQCPPPLLPRGRTLARCRGRATSTASTRCGWCFRW